MKHHCIKIVTALLGAALLFSACEKVTLEDSRLLLGSWGYEEVVSMPVIMSFYENGAAEYYVGPGCFGEASTAYYNWTLTDKGHQVHFTADGQSTPTIKWELRKVTPDTLFVKERLRTDGNFTDAIDRTYLRIRHTHL
ncbi:MAG: hypothetical protein IJ524_01240 [Bacteroidales bacterium]|nr:hypothetical protein [Bacteroidales bacterium]